MAQTARDIRIQRQFEEFALGKTFFDWTPLSISPIRGSAGEVRYLCRCKCGNEAPVKKKALLGGKSRRCKTCADVRYVSSIKQLVGTKFSKWTVLSVLEDRDVSGRILLLCQCDCGIQLKMPRTSLERGTTKSCKSCFVSNMVRFKKCLICFCFGHKNVDFATNTCELLGFCEKCDKFNVNKFLSKEIN